MDKTKIEKVLVCITPQSNSRRLINKGYEVSKGLNGELHILHVEEGNSLFKSEETARLLQTLFDYGSQLGGYVHALCDDNIPGTIKIFALEKEITKIVVGERPDNCNLIPEDFRKENILGKILNTITNVEIIILERYDV